MALTDALAQGAAGLEAFGKQMAAISGSAVQVTVTAAPGPGADRTEAEAIKRGQKPESIAAMRKALGL